MKIRKAFTLAELLLALTIVGVIASLTLPVLFSNIETTKLRTAWKRNYSDVAQALLMAKNDNAGDLSYYVSNTRKLYLLLSQYLNTVKVCNATFPNNCFPSYVQELNGTYVGGSGGLSTNPFDDGSLALNNGSMISIENDAGSSSDHYNSTYFAYIWLDVNGLAKPNTIGKDIFGIIVFKDRIIPMGSTIPGIPISAYVYLGNETQCIPGTTIGIACSSEYLKE